MSSAHDGLHGNVDEFFPPAPGDHFGLARHRGMNRRLSQTQAIQAVFRIRTHRADNVARINIFYRVLDPFGGEVCVDAIEGDERLVEAGGPDQLTQREVAELAFDVLGKPAKVTVVPMGLARGLVRCIGMLSTQFGDLADFIVTSGEVDGVGPVRGRTTLRSYFEELASS